MPSRGKTLLTALALCAAIAGLMLALPVLGKSLPAPLVFAIAVALAVPLLILVMRAWRKFLWARRLEAARQRAEAAAPGDPEPHVELGVLCSLAGAEEQARAAFERARSVQPGHPQATVGLAHLAAEDGDLDGALALFTEAAEKDPKHFAAQYGMGGVHRRREQYARAILSYEKALAIEPDDPFTLAELSRCHLLLGDPAKAEEYFERAAAGGVRDAELEELLRADDEAD